MDEILGKYDNFLEHHNLEKSCKNIFTKNFVHMIIEKLLKNFKYVYMHFIQKIPLKTLIPEDLNNNILNVHLSNLLC